jgi:hypothetical protein
MSTETVNVAAIKRVTIWMRVNLLISTVLCFFAGISLFIGTEQTDQFSAWTIASPITAAFIGAAYWGAGFFLTLLSARERDWARARIGVPAVYVFAVLGVVSTVMNFDRFHLNSGSLVTQIVTYFWLIPYGVGWLMAVLVTVHQVRQPGGDPPRERPLPDWLRFVLVVQSAVLLIVGLSLFISPETATTLWPWALTPLTAQVTAAWLVGLGVGAAQTVWENDFGRSYAAAVSYTMFSVLELVVLVRYPNNMNWGSPQAWIYIVFLLSFLATGLYTWLRAGLRPSRQIRTERPAPASA